MLQPITKSHHLADPIGTCGDRVYVICSQNGLFADPWDGHVPGEMWGVWNHPIKLLDGFWFGVSAQADDPPQWLLEAVACRAYPGYTEFDYRYGHYTLTRRDFVPDGVEGLIVTLTLHTDEPPSEEHTLAAPPLILHALFRSDLRPAWLGEQADLHDGHDSVETRAGAYIFSDQANPWACIVEANVPPLAMDTGDELWAAQRTRGNGTSAYLRYALHSGEANSAVIIFFIAGSQNSPSEALAGLEQLKLHHAELFRTKTEHYQAIAATSQVITPDATLNDALVWSKLINQMLLRHVPPYGAGVGAGLPEYPWWFGIDTEYAVLPMLQSGQFELVRESLRLLQRWSQQHNSTEPGRVLHEMSTTGIAYNKGNMVETPAFTRAVHQYWLWTGDRAFLEEMYPFCKKGLLTHTLSSGDPDGDLCAAGRSIIETPEMHAGFEVIDVAAYTWDGLIRLIDMARSIGDNPVVPELQHNADKLANLIRSEWWLEDEGLFADVRASITQTNAALSHLEHTARQENWSPEARRQVQTARRLFEPYLAKYGAQQSGALRAQSLPPLDIDLPWLLRHWVVMCPLEIGLATPTQAERTLQRLQSSEFGNEWGMYLHPQRHDVMSINTGMLALSAARYGHVDDALVTIHKLCRAFSYRTPGAVAEALPDQWCFMQLWSNVGLVSPVVECFLGIEPRAGERKLRIVPHLPTQWERAEIHQLRVADTSIDVYAAQDNLTNGDGTCSVRVAGISGWTVEVGIVLPRGAQPATVHLNGQPATWRMEHTNAGTAVICAAPDAQTIELNIHLHIA